MCMNTDDKSSFNQVVIFIIKGSGVGTIFKLKYATHTR